MPSGLIVNRIVHSAVSKARSMNGLVQMPQSGSPCTARRLNVVDSAVARPAAMAICPRGMARVMMTRSAAGSQSR